MSGFKLTSVAPELKSRVQFDSKLIALCPRRDLFATVTDDKRTVSLYRFDGQPPLDSHESKDGNQFETLCWEPNGSFIDVTGTDGAGYITTASGPITYHKVDTEPSVRSKARSSQFVFVGWCQTLVDPTLAQSQNLESKQYELQINGLSDIEKTIQDWEQSGSNQRPCLEENLLNPLKGDQDESLAQLQRALAVLDITSELPRLNGLPEVAPSSIPDLPSPYRFTGDDAKVHGSIFEDAKGVVELRFLCGTDGWTRVDVNKKCYLGEIQIVPANDTDKSKVIAHASTPFSSTHAFLLGHQNSSSARQKQETSTEAGFSLCIASMRAVRGCGNKFSLVLTFQDALGEIMRYIIQAVTSLREAWKTSQELPLRFMANINEDLEAQGGPSLVTALYHLAVTGDCYKEVKEWLMDQVGERGTKRWHDSTSAGYATIRRVIHENLLPALERASVIASRLRTLSRTPNLPLFEVDEIFPTRLLEDLDILRLLAHSMLRYAVKESNQLEIFLDWVMTQIHLFRSEENSAAAIEAAEKIASFDFNQLLAYITGPLSKSNLNIFLQRDTDYVLQASRVRQKSSARPIILSILERHKKEPMQPTSHVVELVNLLYQTLIFRDSCYEIFNRVVSGFERTTDIVRDVLRENEPMTSMRDIRMVFEQFQSNETAATYVVAVPEAHKNQVCLYHVVHDAELPPPGEGPERGIRSSQTLNLVLGDGQIKDVKFVDDDFYMVLFSTKTKTHLLHLPYSIRIASLNSARLESLFNTSTPALPQWSTLPNQLTSSNAAALDLSGPNALDPFIASTFVHADGPADFAPATLQVNGRKDRRTVLLLDESRRRVRVFRIEKASGRV